MSENFWNERYSSEEYAYGTEPSKLLQLQLKLLRAGKILFPAEGEGRNAVYAAQCGWNVTAFDQSTEGKRKALLLAESKNVRIEYFIESFESISLATNDYDALALMFVHIPSEVRTMIHRKFLSYLKPGGIVILEAFTKNQLQYSSGGPKNLNQLYSLNEIAADFDECDMLLGEEKIVTLNEGQYHSGDASVIHFVGKKR